MRIDIQSLNHTFENTAPPVHALHDINLQVEPGEFVAIIGPSGCGKSTLLRLLANLLQPSQGQIELDGLSPAQAVAGRRVAWMAQNPALMPWYTAHGNVALVHKITAPSGNGSSTPEALLRLVGLGDFLAAYPHTLSGGMQQRLALARTLALDADVWLMDEPFAALDELTRERMIVELLDLWQRSRPTVLWVTHHIYEATRLAHRVIVMTPQPGRIQAHISVPLPQPRDDTAPEFQALIRRIRSALISPPEPT